MPLLVKDYGKTAIRTYSGWAGPERQAHVIGGDVLGIPVGARNRRLALAMIQFLQSHMVQEALTDRLGWPSLRSDIRVSTTEAWMRPHAEGRTGSSEPRRFSRQRRLLGRLRTPRQ